MGQRGVAGAEIIEGDLDAVLPELCQRAGYAVGIAPEKHGLGDLHFEEGRWHLEPVERPQHVVDHARLGEFRRRQIQRDPAER